ncbi:cell division protein ZapA [uncultured Enterococcus sp.]|uniref:cell division protein ZapA n=1 Tax=uncultured Enterococcus sp. TaxID=167972 RepID=UPI00200B7FF7|nr:cell division protein ZapA [Enterococcus cecorum]
MSSPKTRYKANIDGQSYTIIGHESKEHMDLVVRLVNEQLNEIKSLSPQIDNEQAAILVSVNAISDQLKKQAKIMELEKENQELHQKTIKLVELENRIKRIEAIEKEAKEVLEKNGQTEVEIQNHVQAQQILNEERKRSIQEKSSQSQEG